MGGHAGEGKGSGRLKHRVMGRGGRGASFEMVGLGPVGKERASG